MTQYPRLMLAAGASGSGKTMLTCGLLQVLKNRKLTVASFKCGPDYIDPMFHEKVIKTKSRNLDTFFTDEETTCYLLKKNAENVDVSIMEGVMGYYDGLGGISDKASAYDLAQMTNTPTILVINTKGMSLSVLAYIKGYVTYRENSHIQGVILNQMSPMLYQEMKPLIEEELGIKTYGYVPRMEDCALESRHLGLVLPQEIELLEEKLQKIAEVLEKTLDVDGLLKLAASAQEIPDTRNAEEKILELVNQNKDTERQVKIAVSRDEAFCFIYEDNLQLLRELGAELIEFSPIHDKEIPKDADGVLFFGGYPELYARQLSENVSMRQSVKSRIEAGLPCIAECGGFMYLHTSMEDMNAEAFDMADVIKGKAYKTSKLNRFGYIELESEENPEKKYKGHEFHYFDSTSNGESFLARKPLRKRKWKCIHETDTLMAGFPHLYYYSNPEIAVSFVEKCKQYQEKCR